MAQIFLTLHILLFALSFAFTAGTSLALDRIAATRDRRIIHAAFVKTRPFSIAGGIGWILTALSGAQLAFVMGYDLRAPWLIASYVLFGVLLAVGVGVHSPFAAKVEEISAVSGPEANAELEALLSSPVHRIASIVSGLCVLALVWLMVARPG